MNPQEVNQDTQSDDLQSLYPFLYSGKGDVDAVLDEVRRSTVEKVGEIRRLREELARAEDDRLLACAR